MSFFSTLLDNARTSLNPVEAYEQSTDFQGALESSLGQEPGTFDSTFGNEPPVNQGDTQTIRTQPVAMAEVQPFLPGAYSGLADLYTDPSRFPQFFPGSTVPGQDPRTLGALAMAGGVSGQQTGLSGDVLRNLSAINPANVANDPIIRAQVEASINPIQRRLQESILPGITSQAQMTGNVGGSRQGVAQGAAIRGFEEEAMNTSARIYADAYGRQLDLSSRIALGLPSVQQGLAAPQTPLYQAGAVNEDYEQRVLNDAISRYNFEQTQPFDMQENYLNLLLGAPTGSSRTDPRDTSNDTQRPSALQAGLGGAAAGFSAYPAGGWWSAGAGALAGILSR